ncbi:MAG: hypothetical protein QQN60_08445, partial [Nitrosopumilus sp.]
LIEMDESLEGPNDGEKQNSEHDGKGNAVGDGRVSSNSTENEQGSKRKISDGDEKQNSEHDGKRKDDAGCDTKPITDGGSNSKENSKVVSKEDTGDEELCQEALKELGDLSEDDLKEFRKVRKKIRS